MVKALHLGFGDSPKTRRHKFNRFRHNVEDYYCAKFQIIPIRGLSFYSAILFYSANIYIRTHTHIHIHRDKVTVIIVIGRIPYK